MFIYKGGQTVKGGTYWDPEKHGKIVLTDGANLPGGGKDTYFKLPESLLLIPMLLLGLALSLAMPYGIGFVAFIAIIALMGALYAAGSGTYKLMKEMFGKTATFGYAPGTSYLAGKKTKKSEKDEPAETDEKDTK